jgi:tRNA modification GTPase
MPDHATIFALSSGQGRAGVAVIRVSGPLAGQAIEALAGRLPPARVATTVWFRHPRTGAPIDQGLALWFPGTRSFTGEPIAEFHTHGGRAVVAAFLGSLSEMAGFRMADPGEFTRRAVENGKLDLTRAEALADLIDADTDLQRRQALAGLEGRLFETVSRWRETILSIKSLIAADVDFADQEDASSISQSEIAGRIMTLAAEMDAILALSRRGRLVVDGYKVVILGRPNVGKSSLLNALAGSEVAIVTEVPGTTRDALEVRLNLRGMPVRIYDTAGLRESEDPVERIGISRARSLAENADLVLLLSDEPGEEPLEPALADGSVIRVRSKVDLIAGGSLNMVPDNSRTDIAISTRSGIGLAEILDLIADHASATLDLAAEPSIVTQERQVMAIRNARQEAHAAVAVLTNSGEIELVDEHVRRMEQELSRLIGIVGVEDVLGAIFARFCIGK